MPRPSLLVLAALVATPALALDEGTYPVTTENGSGELTVTRGWAELFTSGPNACEIFTAGPVLRGQNGEWAAIIDTGEEPCVLLGSRNAYSVVGASCAALVEGDCRLAGSIGGDPQRTARPIQVIRPIIEGRFRNLSEEGKRGLQALLAEEDLYAGTIDGIYGPATEDAFVAYMQRMADRGEPVDGNSTSFIRELMTRLAEDGQPPVTAAAPPPAAEDGQAAIYVGSWSCGGYTFRFTEDRYQMINEYDGSVLNEGRLRPDGVVGRTAYLELVGYGNLTFDGVGTRDMVMHDPSNQETWNCTAR